MWGRAALEPPPSVPAITGNGPPALKLRATTLGQFHASPHRMNKDGPLRGVAGTAEWLRSNRAGMGAARRPSERSGGFGRPPRLVRSRRLRERAENPIRVHHAAALYSYTCRVESSMNMRYSGRSGQRPLPGAPNRVSGTLTSSSGSAGGSSAGSRRNDPHHPESPGANGENPLPRTACRISGETAETRSMNSLIAMIRKMVEDREEDLTARTPQRA